MLPWAIYYKLPWWTIIIIILVASYADEANLLQEKQDPRRKARKKDGWISVLSNIYARGKEGRRRKQRGIYFSFVEKIMRRGR